MGGDWVELEKRVEILEQKYDDLSTRVLLAERDIQSMFKKLDKIEGNTSKIIWLIITAVGLAVLNSVLKGGVVS